MFLKLRTVLAVHTDLLSGDDGDSMPVFLPHHLINQTPFSSAWLKLKDIINGNSFVVVVFVVFLEVFVIVFVRDQVSRPFSS